MLISLHSLDGLAPTVLQLMVTIGQLQDDVILLQLPESSSLLSTGCQTTQEADCY